MRQKLFSEYTNTYENVRSQFKDSQDAFKRKQSAIDRDRYDMFDLPSRGMVESGLRATRNRPEKKTAQNNVTEFPQDRLSRKPKQQKSAAAKQGDMILFPTERTQKSQNNYAPKSKQKLGRNHKQDIKQNVVRKQHPPRKATIPAKKDMHGNNIKPETMQPSTKALTAEPVKQADRKRQILNIVFAAVAFMLVAAIGTLLAVRQYSVVGSSMEPTLMEGDRLYYTSFQDVSRGDIVIFDAGDEYGLVVKRVIGLPGDTIQVSASGAAVRNMELLDELYIQSDIYNNSGMREVVVQDGMAFLMGDNRADSIDSRDVRIGQVPISSICGKVRFVVRGVE